MGPRGSRRGRGGGACAAGGAAHPPMHPPITNPTLIQIASAVTSLLSSTIAHNDPLISSLLPTSATQMSTPFYSAKPHSFSLYSYVLRIISLTAESCSPAAFVVPLIYLSILTSKDKSFAVNSHNVCRLLAASSLVAHKMLDDEVWSNEYWAKVAGVKNPEEMNRLEMTLLKACDFRMSIKEEEFRFAVKTLRLEHLTEIQIDVAAETEEGDESEECDGIDQDHE
mmetsp:Transcript_12566/g.31761  ORF Transcript_12566/g.31761 Transcript_12566/m.31761 type:complete len:225 (-) Transcript_12566:162-836(-)